MKRWIAACLCAVLALSLAACSGSAPAPTAAPTAEPTAEPTPVPTPTPDPRPGWTKWTWDVWLPNLPWEKGEYEHTIQDQSPCHIFEIGSYDEAVLEAYMKTLTDNGYTLEPTGDDDYTGEDPEGNGFAIEIKGKNMIEIRIYKRF